MTRTYEVDLEVGPFADPVDVADRLTDAVGEGAPVVAFGANLRTGLVGVTAQVGASSPQGAVVQVMTRLDQAAFQAGVREESTTVRASAEVPAPA